MAGVLGTRTQGRMSRRRRNHGALATAHEKELVLPKPVEIANEHTSIQQALKWVDPMKPNNFETSNESFQYQQVFNNTTGFIQNACILDALFAMGGKQVLSMIS